MALGEQLRRARLSRNLSASEVAAATRMKTQIVEAIEAEDFGRMAAPIYAKGFIKLYAEYVGLDPGPLIEDYLAGGGPARSAPLVQARREAPSPPPPEPAKPSRPGRFARPAKPAAPLAPAKRAAPVAPLEPVEAVELAEPAEPVSAQDARLPEETPAAAEPEEPPPARTPRQKIRDLFPELRGEEEGLFRREEEEPQAAQPPEEKIAPPPSRRLSSWSAAGATRDARQSLASVWKDLRAAPPPLKIASGVVALVIVLVFLISGLSRCAGPSGRGAGATGRRTPERLRVAVQPPQLYVD